MRPRFLTLLSCVMSLAGPQAFAEGPADHEHHDHGGEPGDPPTAPSEPHARDHAMNGDEAHADATHDPSTHDHGAHDHGAHDHGAHDHGAHDHGANDHGAHDHGADHPAGHDVVLGAHHHGGGTSYAVALGVIAAGYDARLFSGDYQGLVVGARWSRGRFGAHLGVPAYRLQKNGKVVYGLGDLLAHGHVALIDAGALTSGLMVMGSAPTGDGDAGLGMGHVMLMADAWVTWAPGRFSLTGNAGYARALGGGSAHAGHGGGMWPLVEPMNASELTFGASGMLALGKAVAAGVRASGAIPVGEGDERLIGGARVVWRAGRVETSAEIQAGLVGDPFTLRGILETAVRFE